MLYHLRSDRLDVEITAPGTKPNDNFRFVRAGFISEVVLDDGSRFCASEPRNLPHPSSCGRGFSYCYRLREGDDVPAGEYFPVPGIGLLKMPESGKYSTFLRYDEGFIPFEIRTELTEDTAVFETLPKLCNGFAFREKRTVAVKDNTIVNDIVLTNEGEKEAKIMEYGHNFISIEGMAVGPDYVITMPQVPDLTGAKLTEAERGGETNFVGEGHGIRMKKYEAQDFSVAIDDVSFWDGTPFVWRVANEAAGAYVEGTDAIDLKRIKFWTCDHMVCPEIYQLLELKPGESAHWQRSLRFEKM